MTYDISLSKEQLALFEFLENEHDHIFVTGRAGTGKSTLLNHFTNTFTAEPATHCDHLTS